MTTSKRGLQRVLGTPGAVLLGLGAIIGTGVYVSIGLAIGIAGDAIMPALAIAALLAACNGLSSAQLAASHPVSGGTYEYGYRNLSPAFGFSAGWLFLVAKSASAATAALGFAGYLRSLADIDITWQTPVALALLVCMTLIVLGGMRTSSRFNSVIVVASSAALLAFAGLMLSKSWPLQSMDVLPADKAEMTGMLHGAALMFVAFTGYGRVATLGEEVHSPRRTIPRAIAWTVGLTFALYLLVATALVGSVDVHALGEAAKAGLPLSWAAEQLDQPGLARVVALGALIAMAGVLLNLVLGLSRVLLAMARRGDMPRHLSTLNSAATSPPSAVVTVGAIIAVIVLIGDIRSTWSFSAFTVLLYYGVTNLAALRLPTAERFVPRIVPVLGLVGCLTLAWFVDLAAWVAGLAVLAGGLAWHTAARFLARA